MQSLEIFYSFKNVGVAQKWRQPLLYNWCHPPYPILCCTRGFGIVVTNFVLQIEGLGYSFKNPCTNLAPYDTYGLTLWQILLQDWPCNKANFYKCYVTQYTKCVCILWWENNQPKFFEYSVTYSHKCHDVTHVVTLIESWDIVTLWKIRAGWYVHKAYVSRDIFGKNVLTEIFQFRRALIFCTQYCDKKIMW